MGKIKLLFVCLGNICRSPVAEAVFRRKVQQLGLLDTFEIDSAGLIAYHQGERADSRMRQCATLRGYSVDSISRPLGYEDFDHFDYIIGMDAKNKEELLERAPTLEARGKISLLTDWHPKPLLDHVPDPYYGGMDGFNLVVDLVEDCTEYLLNTLLQRHGLRTDSLKEQLDRAIEAFCHNKGLSEFSPRAIFFDMDGVLFDTIPAHVRSWCEAAQEFSLQMTPEDVYMFEGQTKRTTINILMERSLQRQATEEEIERIYAKKTALFVQYDTAEVIPDVAEVLDRVKCLNPVLVTGSSQQTLLERVDKAFPKVFKPDRVVSGLNVRYGKPHPEPYLRAAEIANVLPNQGIVVENAPMGVRSGHKAGCFVVAVNTGPLSNQILYDEGADLVLPDMLALEQTIQYLQENYNFALH